MEPVKMSKFEICTICTLGNDVACKLTCHDALVSRTPHCVPRCK